MYKKVFYRDFNLRFKQVKKDTGKTCDVFKVLSESRDKVTEDLQAAKREHEDHLHAAVDRQGIAACASHGCIWESVG